jgi:hypothetical protein
MAQPAPDEFQPTTILAASSWQTAYADGARRIKSREVIGGEIGVFGSAAGN